MFPTARAPFLSNTLTKVYATSTRKILPTCLRRGSSYSACWAQARNSPREPKRPRFSRGCPWRRSAKDWACRMAKPDLDGCRPSRIQAAPFRPKFTVMALFPRHGGTQEDLVAALDLSNRDWQRRGRGCAFVRPIQQVFLQLWLSGPRHLHGRHIANRASCVVSVRTTPGLANSGLLQRGGAGQGGAMILWSCNIGSLWTVVALISDLHVQEVVGLAFPACCIPAGINQKD